MCGLLCSAGHPDRVPLRVAIRAAEALCEVPGLRPCDRERRTSTTPGGIRLPAIACWEGVGKETVFQHFVLTRFSYRGARVNTADDPLDPSRLRRRMGLLEAVTAPSMASQTSQAFTWVVIVDPALPGEFLIRLHALTARHRNLRNVEFRTDRDVERLGWLDQLSPNPPARWILTTNLDDDDALSQGFVEVAQREARAAIQHRQPLTLFGVESAQHWRLAPRRHHELGSVDAWNRSLPVSAGLSLLCDRNALELSVLAVTHRDASRYGSTDLPADLPAFRASRINRVNDIVRGQLGESAVSGFYRPFRSAEAVALMVSHRDNVQAGRIYGADGHRDIDVEPTLRRYGVDVSRARSMAPDCRLGWHNALGRARRLYRSEIWGHENLSFRQRIRVAMTAARRVFFGFDPPAHRVGAAPEAALVEAPH